jgi:hypothetical protein
MKLLAPLLLFPLLLAAQTAVEGLVTNSVTGAPVPGVSVRLDKLSATTDLAGAFRFGAVKPGAYEARFTATGYLFTTQRLNVSGVSSSVRLDLSFEPLATISGRVLTPDGRPVAGASVLLSRGQLRGNEADKDGRYHFQDVMAGTCDLTAFAPVDFAAPPDEDGHPMAWIRTTTATLATTPGAVISRDLTLQTGPARRLKGLLTGPTGKPAARVPVKAVASNENVLYKRDIIVQTSEDGVFEFPALHEGGWRLSAELESEGSKFTVGRYLQLVGSDIEHFDIALHPPFVISGKVVWNAPAAVRPRIRPHIHLIPMGAGAESVSTEDDESGNFHVEGVAEGRYAIRAVPLMPPFYVASIRYGEREVADETVEIASGGVPITVTLNYDGGIVRGTVEDGGGATVVLIRTGPLTDVSHAKCQPNGSFEISGLQPGEYRLLAFENPPDGANYFDLALVTGAVHATVRANEVTSVSLKVTRR